MMHELTNTTPEWMALFSFTLGLRHGFDLDHLATIDAICRTQSQRPLFARWVGALFSLGHGVVVTAAALIIGSGLLSSHIPQWFEGLGKGISLFFLLFFGALTLWSVFFSKGAAQVPLSIKSFLAKRLSQRPLSPLAVLGIGALFAFSFDTLSQVALFAMTGSMASASLLAGLLGLSFTGGMLVSDGLNGLVISSLIQKAQRGSLVLSKTLGLGIALFSLYLGFIGLSEIFF